MLNKLLLSLEFHFDGSFAVSVFSFSLIIIYKTNLKLMMHQMKQVIMIVIVCTEHF